MGSVKALMSPSASLCHQSVTRVILCLLMQLQLSPHPYIHQHLLNDRFLFRIWAEEIVRRVCNWLHRETSKELLLTFKMSHVRTGYDFLRSLAPNTYLWFWHLKKCISYFSSFPAFLLFAYCWPASSVTACSMLPPVVKDLVVLKMALYNVLFLQ